MPLHQIYSPSRRACICVRAIMHFNDPQLELCARAISDESLDPKIRIFAYSQFALSSAVTAAKSALKESSRISGFNELEVSGAVTGLYTKFKSLRTTGAMLRESLMGSSLYECIFADFEFSGPGSAMYSSIETKLVSDLGSDLSATIQLSRRSTILIIQAAARKIVLNLLKRDSNESEIIACSFSSLAEILAYADSE
ncbi:hypothetical protein HY990_07105 [Candidatus Micrarchaeota archaeon]|nr:hypothetical protein [Candidatus Micrarchaeota archaeon]